MSHHDEHEQVPSNKPMTEEEKRAPGAWEGNEPGHELPGSQPPSTTSEPGYDGSQGQQQPAQDGERPDGAGQVDRPGVEPVEEDDITPTSR